MKITAKGPWPGLGAWGSLFWVPAKAADPGSVFCRMLRMLVPAGCSKPLELHASPSASGRREPDTLGGLFRLFWWVVPTSPTRQRLNEVRKMMSKLFSAALLLPQEPPAGVHLLVCDQQWQEEALWAFWGAAPFSPILSKAGTCRQSCQSDAALIFIWNVQKIQFRTESRKDLRISFPRFLSSTCSSVCT